MYNGGFRNIIIPISIFVKILFMDSNIVIKSKNILYKKGNIKVSNDNGNIIILTIGITIKLNIIESIFT